MDTTYFWRDYWYMVFRSYELEKNLLRFKVDYETIKKYKEWIKYLQSKWRTIKAIVCDWRKWLLWWFGNIPTQMCLFHQKQIMIRYLTRKPKLEENKELKDIVKYLWELKEDTIHERLDSRYDRNCEWLKEKNELWKFIHVRTRKAYKSLVRNLPFLYTCDKHKNIPIPNTTNALEWWVFSWLKEKLWNHRWLKPHRKQKWIERYLNYS